MESRKYQLQQQILEALKADDNDLYSLLKSQWAHRFGVESLEELNNLNLQQFNKKTANVDTETIDQSEEKLIESDKPISIKEDDNQEKQIQASVIESIKDNKNGSMRNQSYQIVEKVNYVNKNITPLKENNNQDEIKPLIPLPPKPKYSYLKKWLLRE